MTFTSLTFLLFLPIVFFLYWAAGKRYRVQNAILVGASYFFYGWWDWRFCGLMLASSLVDYVVGYWLSRTDHRVARNGLLLTSVACNLCVLGFFKYYNFFAESLLEFGDAVGWKFHLTTLQIILPVGISFYTFQTLSYTIDVYRRRLEPSRHLLDYLAFVSFFPQLVAGPIERASRLLPQFQRPRSFCETQAFEGCRWMLWGFIKKVAIADRLALFVDEVYGAHGEFSGPTLAVATVFFAFQIYCDFSAYSDIAIGVAKLFNISLMRNFAYPYFSQSVGEFWRRWHISLSSWFRDYVYIPLGGGRSGRIRKTLNIVFTFALSGLWHGAAMQFVVWGVLNGFGAAFDFSHETRSASDTPGGERFFPKMGVAVRIAATFAFICVGWIFFRADSVIMGWEILNQIVVNSVQISAWSRLLVEADAHSGFKATLALLCGLVAIEWIWRRKECPLVMDYMPQPVRWLAYTVCIWGALALAPSDANTPFIYFAF